MAGDFGQEPMEKLLNVFLERKMAPSTTGELREESPASDILLYLAAGGD